MWIIWRLCWWKFRSALCEGTKSQMREQLTFSLFTDLIQNCTYLLSQRVRGFLGGASTGSTSARNAHGLVFRGTRTSVIMLSRSCVVWILLSGLAAAAGLCRRELKLLQKIKYIIDYIYICSLEATKINDDIWCVFSVCRETGRQCGSAQMAASEQRLPGGAETREPGEGVRGGDLWLRGGAWSLRRWRQDGQTLEHDKQFDKCILQ